METGTDELSSTARMMALVRAEWEAPLRARIAELEAAVAESIVEAGLPNGLRTAVARLTGVLAAGLVEDLGAEQPDSEPVRGYVDAGEPRLFQVWSEGFPTHDGRGKATLRGTRAATSWDAAVLDVADRSELYSQTADGRWQFWGRDLFEFEEDARRRFG